MSPGKVASEMPKGGVGVCAKLRGGRAEEMRSKGSGAEVLHVRRSACSSVLGIPWLVLGSDVIVRYRTTLRFHSKH